jgi:hypothetical protein
MMHSEEDSLLKKAMLVLLGANREIKRDIDDWLDRWMAAGKAEWDDLSPSNIARKSDIADLRADIEALSKKISGKAAEVETLFPKKDHH